MKQLKALVLAALQATLYFACVLGTSTLCVWLGGNLPGAAGAAFQDGLFCYAVACVVTIAVFLAIYRVTGRGIAEYLPVRPLSSSLLSRLFLVGMGLNFATSITMELIPLPDAIITEYKEFVEGSALLGNKSVLAILLTVVLAPLAEELVFRAGVLNTLKRGRVPFALLIHTAVFAGIHGVPYQIIYAIPGGIILGLVYLWTDNFLAPLFVHMVYNALSAAFAYYDPPIGSDRAQQALLFVILASVTGMIYALRSLKKERSEQEKGRFDKTV